MPRRDGDAGGSTALRSPGGAAADLDPRPPPARVRVLDAPRARTRARRRARGDRVAAARPGPLRARRAPTRTAGPVLRVRRPVRRLRGHLLAELRLDRPWVSDLRHRGRVRARAGKTDAPVRQGAGARTGGRPERADPAYRGAVALRVSHVRDGGRASDARDG